MGFSFLTLMSYVVECGIHRQAMVHYSPTKAITTISYLAYNFTPFETLTQGTDLYHRHK